MSLFGVRTGTLGGTWGILVALGSTAMTFVAGASPHEELAESSSKSCDDCFILNLFLNSNLMSIFAENVVQYKIKTIRHLLLNSTFFKYEKRL